MMRMSTKGHHATRLMIYLANSPGRPVSKGEMGQAESISPGYVQQVIGTLTAAGLVRSHRGKEGGFSLARPAENITVQQVLNATEGPFELAPCVDKRHCCVRMGNCPAHQLWLQAAGLMNGLFEQTTIADLARAAQQAE